MIDIISTTNTDITTAFIVLPICGTGKIHYIHLRSLHDLHSSAVDPTHIQSL